MDLTFFFGKFQLDILSDFWVESVWNGDFCNEKEFPPEYELIFEEIDFFTLMNDFCVAIREWVSNPLNQSNVLSVSADFSVERKSWSALVNKNVDPKPLIAVISTFIKEDIKTLRNQNEVNLALGASRLYFMLLSIHGAHVFNVFNTVFFCQALETLKILKVIFCNKTPLQKEKKRGKAKKNQHENDDEAADIEEFLPIDKSKGKSKKNTNEEESEEMASNEESLSYSDSEKVQLIEAAIATLDDLAFCLRNLDLKSQKDALTQIIQVLVIITSLEKVSTNIFSSRPKPNSVGFLAHKSFSILDDICDPSFGDVEEIVRSIMKAVLPCLCPNEQDFLSNSSVSRSLSVQRENVLNFIYRVISKVKEASYNGVIAAVQQLCVRTPDKADVRAKCVHVIVSILEHLPPVLFNRLILWLLSLCYAELVRYRLVGVEILASLLHSAHEHLNLYETPEPTLELTKDNNKGNMSLEYAARSGSKDATFSSLSTLSTSPPISSDDFTVSSPLSVRLLVSAVISKCLDISPTVRTKALTTLASLIMHKEPPVEDIIMDTFIHSYISMNIVDKLLAKEEKFFNFKSFFKSRNFESNVGISDLNSNPMPGGTVIMDMVEKLSQDDKVFVKKAALSVFCNICMLSGKWLTPKRMQLLTQSCKDLSLVVRKHMTSCLTDLLMAHPTNNQLLTAWFDGVFPLIGDNELKSQEKVLEITSKLIIDNMEYHDKRVTAYSLLPWKILTLICNKGKRKLFRIVCRYWASENKIRSAELKKMRTHLGTENNFCTLFLLVCIAEYQDIHNSDYFLEEYYTKIHAHSSVTEFECQLILEGIFLSLHEINEENKLQLCSSIKKSVDLFSVPLPLISRCMDIFHHINPNEMKPWAKKLIKDIELHLKRLITCKTKESINGILFRQYIYTLGEASMAAPKVVSEETITTLVALIDIYEETNIIPKEWKDKISSQTLSVIIVTLGKICLQEHLLAKSVVPVFGNLLNSKSTSEVKINSLVALTDLCIRYTSLVEVYLGDICVCLKDKDVTVRKMTLTLLMQLIKEDYIKLRSPYFFYLLCMLEDESEEIKEEASSFLINCALTKQGNIMAAFFIQALYFFNDYEGQNQYTRVLQSELEREVFCISGEQNRELRRRLYRFMLDHMRDDHKFKITHRLSTDILCEVSQGTIRLEGYGSLLLEDALFCLACDEIRILHMNQSKDLSDDGSGEFNHNEIIGNICKRSIISQALKKSYIDVVIPIILSLRTKLVELKSPLVRDLRIALRELMKDFKDELKEILANDSDAAAEISLELRKIEEHERATMSPTVCRQQEEAVVSIQNIYVQCERLSKQVLATWGTDLPDAQENSQEGEQPIFQPPNADDRIRDKIQSNVEYMSQGHDIGSSSKSNPRRDCRESKGKNSAINTDNTKEADASLHKETSQKKSSGNVSLSPSLCQIEIEKGVRPNQSSLSTAYGDSSHSMLHTGTRDSSVQKELPKKRRSANEDSFEDDKSDGCHLKGETLQKSLGSPCSSSSSEVESSAISSALTSNSSASCSNNSSVSSVTGTSRKKPATNKKKRKRKRH